MENYETAMDMMNEAIMTVELFRQASRISRMMSQGVEAEQLERQMARFYKNYHSPIDQETFEAMMKAYFTQMPSSFAPAFYTDVVEKYQGDFSKFAEAVYSKTLFNNEEKLAKLFLGDVPWYEWSLEEEGTNGVLLNYVQYLMQLPEFQLI